ncbi:MAG: glycosyltransferase [Desulfobacteraceae bacterium]|nr:glycosyltransferase [Desulfobacteraceae bacterium]MBC2756738.1 glycosyltransferase [Desulfobacteraceae bacterium]
MISVIFPAFNEQDNIMSLYKRLISVASKVSDHEFEFIFVDDCSKDQTFSILLNLRNTDKRLHVIRFSKNSGSHAAITAGLSACRGDIAVVLAADLQDPPEIIPDLLNEWGKGFKVVWGVRKERKGEKIHTKLLSRFFYFLMNRMTTVKRPSTGADVVLVDRIVIDAFKQSVEKNISVFMLIVWLGFPQTYIDYIKEERYAGSSKWSFSRRLKILFDSLISFSYIPLRFMSLIGIITALCGFLYGVIIFINGLRGLPVQGWATMMIVILILGGFQLVMMGLLGEYIWRTYDETRSRPNYVIEKNTLINDLPSTD